MIEIEMVRRMVKRGLLLAPVLAGLLWLLLGPKEAWSGVLGLALTLSNLWVAGRVIGGVAENAPQMLMVAAFAALGLGLLLLTAAAVVLRSVEAVDFTVTGLTLVGSHIALVVAEAATSLLKIPSKKDVSVSGSIGLRS